MTPSPMFRTIVEYCTLPAAHAHTWWTALEKARWTVARSWLQDLVYFDAHPVVVPDAVAPWAEETTRC
jgi:hypothetical protein